MAAEITDAELTQWEHDARRMGTAEPYASMLRLIAAYRAERETAERFQRLDSQAATYVESVICMRTHFTGNPPYVGWQGLGLALNEALDARDNAKSALATLREAARVLVDRIVESDGHFLLWEESNGHSCPICAALARVREALASADIPHAPESAP